MKIFKIFAYAAVMIFVLLCIVSLFLLLWHNERNRQTLQKLTLTGKHYVDGVYAGAFPEVLDYSSVQHSISFTGSFNIPLEKRQKLILQILNLDVSISVNGNELYNHQSSGNGYMRKSINSWVFLDLPCDITAADRLEINIRNIFEYNKKISFEYFFDNLYTGSEYHLFTYLIKKHALLLVPAVLTIMLGLVMFLLYFMFFSVYGEALDAMFLLGLLSAMYGSWYLMDIASFFGNFVIINNIDLLMFPVFIFLFLLYLRSYISEKWHKYIYIIIAIQFLLYLLPFAWMIEPYEMQYYNNIILHVATVLVLLMVLLDYLKNGNNAPITLMMLFIPVWIAMIYNATVVTPDHYRPNDDYGCLALLCSIFLHFIYVYRIQLRRTRQMEQELVDGRLKLAFSQIHPHFLYNSLACITMLCDTEPRKARQASVDFSRYLRVNLESIGAVHLIPFSKELEHINTYLSLEMLRFGDKLNIVYDIQSQDFMLPPLSIQPLVENAVIWGVGEKEYGGTVHISSAETDTAYEITISDDGAGFDPAEPHSDNDGNAHVGLENVKKRLRAQCSASVDIHSTAGVGTTVIVRIPKILEKK